MPQNYISSVRFTPDYNAKTLQISRYCVGEGNFYACIKDGDDIIAEGKTDGDTLVLDASACMPWSPESPKLYTVMMRYGEDEVQSYFGMRGFSTSTVNGKRVLALTEFGGYSFAMKGHVFTAKRFGYKGFKSQAALVAAYKKLYRTEIIPAILRDSLCASVYTQLTDVEDEVNGIFTYDRVLKIPAETLRALNGEVYAAFERAVKEKQ